MEACILWASGSVTYVSTPVLASHNGDGVALDMCEVDVSDPEGVGVLVCRRAWVFGSADLAEFPKEADPEVRQKVIVAPDEIADLVQLSINGRPLLARVTVKEDGSGFDRQVLSPDGDLVNVALGQWGRPVGESGTGACGDAEEGERFPAC